MSVIQCTPETNRPTTINKEKAIEPTAITLLKVFFFILRSACSTNVGITVTTRSVVDDGYEASITPFISIGL